MPLKSLMSIAQFSGEYLCNPAVTGAIVPSGRALGRQMTASIPANPPGYVVELGAGTGAITHALLQRGVPAEKIVSIDCVPSMVKLLKERFPNITVLSGSAAQLRPLLETQFNLDRHCVSHVVSSLPLRSLPITEVRLIAEEVRAVLRHGGEFIQFTYSVFSPSDPGFTDWPCVSTRRVWWNIPPARVKVYRLPAIHPQPLPPVPA